MERAEVDRVQAETAYCKAARPGGAARLAHEAQVLRALRHPGVVALATDPGREPLALELEFVPGGDLRGRRFPAEQVAGLGAAAATTLADLHDLGAVYGACAAEHILLDARGAPVLCSLGAAALGLDPRTRAAGQESDVRQLIGVLLEILDGDGGTVRRRLLRSARQRHPSARALARTLSALSGARLPEEASPNPPTVAAQPPGGIPYRTDTVERTCVPQTWAMAAPEASAPAARLSERATSRRAWPRGWIVAGGALVAAILAGLTLAGHEEAGSSGARCPPVDDGCQAVPTPGGVLTTATGRWSLGQPGDIVVLGRWTCAPVAFPAVLQTPGGQVWIFDRWASAQAPVRGRLLGRVPGATGVQVAPGARGCDRVEVTGPGRRRTLLDPPEHP